MIVFKVHTKPIAKGRPIFGKGNVRTPKRTKDFENKVASAARKEMKRRKLKPTKKPLFIELGFVFEPPNSWPDWKKKAALRGLIEHTSKPDKDNLEKAVTDSLNKIVFEDDSQIVDGREYKYFGESNMIEITIRELNSAPSTIKTKKELELWSASNKTL